MRDQVSTPRYITTMHGRDRIILWIGAIKLVKGIALVSFGIAILALGRDALASDLRYWAMVLGVGPEHVDDLVARVTSIDPSTLREVGAGAILYASLYFIEGIGLLRRRVWAEYFTVVITTSFIPIEVYEMIAHESVTKAVVIAINVLAVGYLVYRLRRDGHWPFARGTGLAARSA
jgi:uncharacterized membrane protein (DUF2068 family)